MSIDTEIRRPLITESIARLNYVASEAFTTSPIDQWDRIFRNIISKYPDTDPYRGIFEHTVRKARHSGNKLDEFWKKYVPTDSGQRDDITGTMKVASSEPSGKMIEEIFRINPNGDTTAEKGVITLRFKVENADFARIVGFGPEIPPKGAAITFTHAPNVEFPVIVFKKGAADDPILTFQNTIHEAEHAVNSHLRDGYELVRAENFSMDSSLKNRLLRRREDPISAESRAKDELLAIFTLVTAIDKSRYGELEDYLPGFRQEVVEVLTADENGGYYQDFKKWDKNFRRETYINNVLNGISSLENLFNIYKCPYLDGKTDFNPARMAINVLEQFPLKSWPGIVRLIRFRHRQIVSPIPGMG